MNRSPSMLLRLTLSLTALLLTAGCQVREDGGASIERSQLRLIDLQAGRAGDAPLDYAFLAPPAQAAPARHTFEGRLQLLDEAEQGSVTYHAGAEGATQSTGHLPEFDFEFIQAGSSLVPVRRGLVISEHPDWDYLLEPGQVWSEPGDDGWSRASLPFFLVAKGGNSNLAGVLTFLYTSDAVSQVYYQITQEIASSFRADLWGSLAAVYTPGPVQGAAELREAYSAELAGRMPTRPAAQLAEAYPGVDIQAFTRRISASDLSTWGLVVDGIHYRGDCTTRSGSYPYCEWLRLPSFSTAKTAFVALALLRLEQEYGPGVADLLIRDYLPETADSRGDWSGVTFGDALDMATGNFSSSGFMVDEEGRIFSEFFGVLTYDEKITAALDWPHSAPPGSTWVYRSSDTFLLVAAMQNFLVAQRGQAADIFRYVVESVYIPLGLGPGFFSTARTADDGWNGLPLGASGLWWLPDDVARLGDFLNNSGGQLAGVQLLDPALLSAALQRDPSDRGLPIPGGSYKYSLWSQAFGPAQGFDCSFSVPYMAGYTGNIIALMPNGITFYYFSDHRDFDWASAVLEADKIAPFCQP